MSQKKRMLEEEISEVSRKLEDLKARWPAHSVKPQMVEELEMLEDELVRLKHLLAEEGE